MSTREGRCLCGSIIIIIFVALLQRTSGSHLVDYDKFISSSLFGEPVFRLEPPNVIQYSNVHGTTLLCLASGSPKPTISWFASASDASEPTSLNGDAPTNSNGNIINSDEFAYNRPVTNITNLRLILQDGSAIRLLPFEESEFRRDVHAVDYRCVASNQVATIHSKSVSIQAVLQSRAESQVIGEQLERAAQAAARNESVASSKLKKQLMDFIRVNDEFVQLEAPVVLKCRIQSAHLANQLAGASFAKTDPNSEAAQRRLSTEWFTSDGLQVSAGEISKGNKFVAFESGELHVTSVEMNDLRRTYGCRLRNLTSRRVIISSNMAQLILIDHEAVGGGPGGRPTHSLAYLVQSQRDEPALDSAQVLHSAEQMVALEGPAHDSTLETGGEREHRPVSYSSRRFWSQGALILPCAIRMAHDKLARSTRWLYQAPPLPPSSLSLGQQQSHENSARAQPVPLDKLAAAANNNNNNNKWLELHDLRQQPQKQPQANISELHEMGAKRTSRLVIGPTYLALERPRASLSGRYILQMLPPPPPSSRTDEPNDEEQQAPTGARNLCDINVIIRQPIRLRMRPKFGRPGRVKGERENYFNEAQALDDARATNLGEPGATIIDRMLAKLSSWSLAANERHKLGRRHLEPHEERALESHQETQTDSETDTDADADAADDEAEVGAVNPLLVAREAARVGVRGPGVVPQVPLLRIGDRLELECAGSGHPIDGVRWFRQGQAINTQSSSDFQTEIVTEFGAAAARPNGRPGARVDETAPSARRATQSISMRSRLLIRQLQARDVGLLIFECFARNQLGDRARASQAVFVAERELVEEARNRCPLDELANGTSAASQSGGGGGGEERDFEAATARWQLAAGEPLKALFNLRNPFRTALVFEGEPIELECPAELDTPPGRTRKTISVRDQVSWFRWSPESGSKEGGDARDEEESAAAAAAAAELEKWAERNIDTSLLAQRAQAVPARSVPAATTGALASPLQRQRFNQLFGGDSRFVINGSSLQIRSPSRRHDETLFVCLRRPARSRRRRRRRHAEAARGQPGAPPNGVHQSSLAGAACLSQLFAAAQVKQEGAGEQLVERAPMPLVSSISIRIVAKPRIDAFEFSRNLEEGMRTMVVCTVVSGQSPIDFNWFKDGELLLMSDGPENSAGAEGEIVVARANEFSSTLTIRKIRPAHSGHYTCVASNALAAAEHTSRLLINVAPYFIEPPRSQRVYLNSNVLINCRAGGQPTPQIRWRKLVNVGGGTGTGSGVGVTGPESPASLGELAGGAMRRQAKTLAPHGANGASLAQAVSKVPLQFDSLNAFGAGDYDMSGPGQQMSPSSAANTGAPAASSVLVKQEFRIITSNSHIQILENGSMLIKEVDLQDSSRYSCQASNGIQPILSEIIDLQVLQPARFGANYETVSVKRDATVKFSCAPRGDQPIQLEWFKEGARLVPLERPHSAPLGSAPNHSQAKYIETLQLASPVSDFRSPPSQQQRSLNGNTTTATTTAAAANSNESATIRRHQLVLAGGAATNANTSETNQNANKAAELTAAMISSELLINSADRSDTGLFVCSARNAFGKDELSYRLIVQEPPDAPFNLQLQSVQASSVRLVWQSPFDGNLAISHFVIEYRRAYHATAGQLAAVGLVESAAASSLSSASSLLPSVAGDWLRLVVSSEQSARNVDEARLLLLEAASSLQPPPPQSPPPLLPMSSGPARGTGLHGVLLKQLSAKSTYQIRVAAVNALGQGLFSPIQLISTAEEAPQARPADLRAQPTSASSIKLVWRGPLALAPDDPAPVRGYHVSYRRPPSPTKSAAASEAGWLATLSLSAANYTSTSPIGAGELLAPPMQMADERAKLTTTTTTAAAAAAAATATIANYELILANLERSSKYEIRVQPFNSMGLGPASEISAQTLRFDRPNQPQLKLVEARKQSLELKWSLAASTSREPSELLGFSLYYKCEYDDWQEIQLGLIYHYVIENLRCGNKYQIYLSGFNSVGRSDPSDVLAVRTEGTTPLAPDKTRLFRANMSEVVLDMSQWSSGGCPISSFMIQFKRLHDTNWFILSEGATPFTQTDRITIPDLTPATWYKLLVTALNEAGSTNAEYIFATLTLDGQQLELPAYLADQQQQQQQNHASSHSTTASADLRQPMKALSLLFSGLTQLLGADSSSAGSPTAPPGSPNQQDGLVLLPLSCILLLLVTSLATYLYYNRANKSLARHQQKCLDHHHQPAGSNCNGSAAQAVVGQLSRSAVSQLQLIDRHLLQAAAAAQCNGDTSSSSSSASMHQHHAQTLRRFDNEKQPNGMLSKSQLLASDANSLNVGRSSFADRLAGTTESSPRSELDNQTQQQSILSGANYVLNSFLDQQLLPDNSTQTSSFVCPISSSHSATLQHASHKSQLTDESLSNLRLATMKLLPRHQQTGPNSIRSNGSHCFDGAASSSVSSSGLGSVQTSASNQSKNLQLMEQQPQPQQPPPPRQQHSLAGSFEQTGNYLLANSEYQMQRNLNSATPLEHHQAYPTAVHADSMHQASHFVQLIEQPAATSHNDYHLSSGPPLHQHQRAPLPASSSFVSAADLIAREQKQQQQQQQQQQSSEPIYQQLDKFKTCALPACRQFATLNPQFAAKFKQDYRTRQEQLQHHQTQQQYSLDDQFIHCQQHASEPTDDGAAASFFMPPPPSPPPPQVQVEPLGYQQQQQVSASVGPNNQANYEHEQEMCQINLMSAHGAMQQAAAFTQNACSR